VTIKVSGHAATVRFGFKSVEKIEESEKEKIEELEKEKRGRILYIDYRGERAEVEAITNTCVTRVACDSRRNPTERSW